MSRHFTGWWDREGRIWLETGHEVVRAAGVDPVTGEKRVHREPKIQLINGAAEGALSWVEAEFGPLTRLDAHVNGE